jgi:D-threo-aldose 1-dehydrogenase
MGLGTAQLGDLFVRLEQSEADAIVDAAWKLGIRYFDTAPHYGLGLSEERLGRALRGKRRADYVISTKVGRLLVSEGAEVRREWDFSGRGVARSIASSLKRLADTHIDVAYIHDPEDHVEQALTQTFPALERMRDAGDVRAIGVGTKDLATLLRFVRECDIDVVMVAGRLTLLDHSALEELVPECDARGIAVVGAGVFNSGLLATEEPSPDSHFDYEAPAPGVLRRARELVSISARNGFTLPEAAVAFAQHSSPPVASLVIGAESANQVIRNVSLLDARGDVAALVLDVLSERNPRTPTERNHE